MVIADEVIPRTLRGRLRRLWRLPLAAAAFLLTQTATHPVTGLPQALGEAGFLDVTEERLPRGDFAVLWGRTAPATTAAGDAL